MTFYINNKKLKMTSNSMEKSEPLLMKPERYKNYFKMRYIYHGGNSKFDKLIDYLNSNVLKKLSRDMKI